MLKGCQREMIVMQTVGSPLFESAYFILRREKRACASGDMLAEANRIIGAGDGYLHRRRRRLPRFGRVAAFLCGLVAGAGILALFLLLFGVLGT